MHDGAVVVTSFPSAAVLDAFDLHGEPARLPGGQGDAFRVGDVVVKFVTDPDEAQWTQGVLDRIAPDGFRCAEPVATTEGRWVHQCWTANVFVGGLRPVAPDWDRVIEIGLRFCAAADRARQHDDAVLAGRTHRWAVADRVAWEEQEVALSGVAGEVLGELLVGLRAGRRDRHFVHGDLSGNVFVDDRDTPVILDVSPYLRPCRWAAAIVLADAVLWHGADVDLLRSFDGDGADLVRRALVFRFVADQLSDHPHPESLVDSYRIPLEALT
jgi:uncharacterized protein (TIGR02569 family)